MKRIFTATYLLILLACDSSNENVKVDGSVELSSCEGIENDRAIVAEFNDQDGFVKAPEEGCSVYTLVGGPDHPERNLNFLAPCNLPENFEEDDLEIVFSGYLYETFETEDICAQAFELTKIEFK